MRDDLVEGEEGAFKVCERSQQGKLRRFDSPNARSALFFVTLSSFSSSCILVWSATLL